MNTSYILRHQIDRSQVFAYAVVLFCAVVIVNAILTGMTTDFVPVSYWIGLGAVSIAIPSAGYDLFSQPYRWWRAVRTGTYAVAEVRSIKRKTRRKSDVMEGTWQFSVGGKMYTRHFRLWPHESGKWIWTLETDDQVHVLIHPYKPNVLIAFGPSDKV